MMQFMKMRKNKQEEKNENTFENSCISGNLDYKLRNTCFGD
jgi:hypothetical protein